MFTTVRSQDDIDEEQLEEIAEFIEEAAEDEEDPEEVLIDVLDGEGTNDTMQSNDTEALEEALEAELDAIPPM